MIVSRPASTSLELDSRGSSDTSLVCVRERGDSGGLARCVATSHCTVLFHLPSHEPQRKARHETQTDPAH